MELMEAIKTRRSVRHYKSDPVPESLLNVVLEAAQWAPSWANTQCWRFIVVKDPLIKAALVETLNKGNPSTQAFIDAPIVIVGCAELKKAGFYKEVTVTGKGDWFMFDLGLTMQNLVLAAHSLGLGTVHVGYFDAKQAAKALDLPEGVVAVEMTPLGYPAREARATPRKPLNEIVFYEKYGQTK